MVKVQKKEFGPIENNTFRRQFLKMGSLAVVGSGLLLACSSDDNFAAQLTREKDLIWKRGYGNFKLCVCFIEHLEAAYYTAFLNGSYCMNGANAVEKKLLEGFYNHEVIHRVFFKAFITANAHAKQVLPELEFDFSGVDFGNRDSVLSTAIVLEDTGVSAYNSAGKLLANPNFLVIAGKLLPLRHDMPRR